MCAEQRVGSSTPASRADATAIASPGPASLPGTIGDGEAASVTFADGVTAFIRGVRLTVKEG